MVAKDTSNIRWDEYYYFDTSSPTFLRNKISKVGVKEGSVAGTINKERGYIFVKLNRKVYPAHRVVWELFNPPLKPDEQVDHINGIRNDNRLCNLRKCSIPENRRNVAKSRRNKSGVCGVRFRQDKLCWVGFAKDANNRELQKSFSIRKYDDTTAKLLASNWRVVRMYELSQAGLVYSDRHGL